MYSFFNLGDTWGGWSTPRPSRFTPPPGKRPGTHFIGGWVSHRAGLDGWGKSRPRTDFESRTVQPAASRYTDWAIATLWNVILQKGIILQVHISNFIFNKFCLKFEHWLSPSVRMKYGGVQGLRIAEQQSCTYVYTKEEKLWARLEGHPLFVTLSDLQTQQDIWFQKTVHNVSFVRGLSLSCKEDSDICLLTNNNCIYIKNFEVRHPRCVGSITKNFCLLHIQSNTTIFHLVVQ